jgi:hypothetical protein
MQFGKLYVDLASDITEAEFYKLCEKSDLQGVDKKEAWKQFQKARPKKVKKEEAVIN